MCPRPKTLHDSVAIECWNDHPELIDIVHEKKVDYVSMIKHPEDIVAFLEDLEMKELPYKVIADNSEYLSNLDRFSQVHIVKPLIEFILHNAQEGSVVDIFVTSSYYNITVDISFSSMENLGCKDFFSLLHKHFNAHGDLGFSSLCMLLTTAFAEDPWLDCNLNECHDAEFTLSLPCCWAINP
jgi:hypothetical protein